jgi:hypothetical protein
VTVRDRTVAGLGLAAILLLSIGVRFTGVAFARGEEGFRPRLDEDGDILYHAVRARQLAETGAVPWFDPALDPPHGARVLWPPLLEGLAVGAAWATSAGAATRASVDRCAATLPVLFGLLSVAAAALLGRRLLGPGHGRLTALGLALAPAAILATSIGRFDQHGLELLLFTLVLLAAIWAQRAPSSAQRRGRAILLGCAVAASFWAWQGSALTLLLLAFAAACDHLLAGREEPPDQRFSLVLAEGALAAGVLLALSVALLGPPGALGYGGIEGVSGLGVAACASTALGAGLLWLAARRPRPRPLRLLELAGAASLAVGLLAAVPTIRAGLLHGLLPVTLANPWYDRIEEFQPLLGRRSSLRADLTFALLLLGLQPLLAIAGAARLPAAAREAPERRTALRVLGSTALALALLALGWRRFSLYAALPLSLLAALGARRLARSLLAARAPRWAPAGAALLTLLAAAPTAVTLRSFGLAPDARLAPVLRIADRLGAAVAAGSARPGVVLASWSRGHHVRFFSGLPALVTPFGSDAGRDTLTDWARFMVARSEPEADAVLDPRGVRWVLLEPEAFDLRLASRLLVPDPASSPRRLSEVPVASQLAVGLLWRDGNAGATAPASAGYRLVDEDFPEGREGEAAKLFERVPGARVEVLGAPPGGRVVATVQFTSPTERRGGLTLFADADASGKASLRLPYALGRNGFVVAEPWRVEVGGRERRLVLSDAQVLSGSRVELSLGRPAR